MDVQCNECKKIINMKPKKKKLKDKIDKHFFQCEHCNHIYIIAYTNESIRQEQNRLRKLNGKNTGNGFYEDKIKEKQELIKSKMKELRDKIEAST